MIYRGLGILTEARPATHRKTEKERHLADGRAGKGGWARSRIIRPQKDLDLYKSFNTLWTGRRGKRKPFLRNDCFVLICVVRKQILNFKISQAHRA